MMDFACLSFKQHGALLSAGLRKIYHYKSVFTGCFLKARQETRDKRQKTKDKRQKIKDKR